ncbi:MAG: hypothetical protein IJV45_03655 [Prevotella sp.]|nr:hypothetical protein [Prevotella sp.]
MSIELQSAIERLRQAVEAAAGREMRTPKDFDFLSECIFDKQHRQISATTLKRIWGYVNANDAMPRKSTLDILAQFVGSEGWDDFVHQDCSTATADDGQPSDGDDGDAPRRRPLRPMIIGLLCLAALIGAAALWSTLADRDGAEDETYTITLGQRFATEQDNLQLFGIHASDTLWGQRLPHHPNISIWEPQYRHWRWHNDGDSAMLMPTITEHWEPDDGSADSTLVAIRNNDHYIYMRDLNELRITFVRGLTPDGDSLTFTGVYRMDMATSNFHHVTWLRVADRIDLAHLDYLEELRN